MLDFEAHMPLTVILAVGLDPLITTAQSAAWRSSGYIVISVTSVKKAIDHFRAGDFDLVLLGNSISLESKERLTFLIRSFGSHTPVVCIGNPSGDHAAFADATLNNDSCESLKAIEELLMKKADLPAGKDNKSTKADLIPCKTELDEAKLGRVFSTNLSK
jgi:DNA-binding response OmpR family regulator